MWALDFEKTSWPSRLIEPKSFFGRSTEALDLEATGATDASCSLIAELFAAQGAAAPLARPKLARLSLRGCRVTDAGARALAREAAGRLRRRAAPRASGSFGGGGVHDGAVCGSGFLRVAFFKGSQKGKGQDLRGATLLIRLFEGAPCLARKKRSTGGFARLDLGRNAVGDAGLEALAHAGGVALAGLRSGA